MGMVKTLIFKHMFRNNFVMYIFYTQYSENGREKKSDITFPSHTGLFYPKDYLATLTLGSENLHDKP